MNAPKPINTEISADTTLFDKSNDLKNTFIYHFNLLSSEWVKEWQWNTKNKNETLVSLFTVLNIPEFISFHVEKEWSIKYTNWQGETWIYKQYKDSHVSHTYAVVHKSTMTK